MYDIVLCKERCRFVRVTVSFVVFASKEMERICVETVKIIYKKGMVIFMDAQLRHGLLEVCVLTSLFKEDSYGYRIIKDISPYIKISESTLYPILRRLESGDYLSVYSVEHNGRLRKYYKITDAGRKKINEFISAWEEVMNVYQYIITETNNNLNDECSELRKEDDNNE